MVRAPGLTVSTTVSFASLWVIPRLASFRARHPEVEVYVSADDRLIDLGRGEVDVAVRYLADASAPDGAVRLFGERMMPVVEPEARAPRRHAARRRRPTSRGTCCCISTIPTGACRGSTGACGSHANGQPGLKPAGSLRFKLYDQVIQAAVGGQGVALGRIPLIAEHLRDGRLAAPFPKRYDSARGYYAVLAPHATRARRCRRLRPWLADEAARELGQGESPPSPRRRA